LDSAKVLSLISVRLITAYITSLALSNISYLLSKEQFKKRSIEELKS